MKTKRVVVGTMAAAILSLSVCTAPVSLAAGETVQISVGSTTAEPGGTFSVDVSLSDIPSTGIQACDFAVNFDSSSITVTEVTAGALTKNGADEADASASVVPLFDSEINNNEGTVALMWSTMLDSTYWLNGEGVFCTIKGTVAADAKAGSKVDLTVGACKRETYPGSGVINSEIKAGYINGTSKVQYGVKTADGAINIGSDVSGVRGDATCDDKVLIDDVIMILSYAANPANSEITAQGLINADVYQTGDGVQANDAAEVQKYLLKLIPKL